ncbi:MAG: hypothetical protein HDS84_02030 [Bacteroidales bacterium]|nr:hypothetical protein [Bacteroidales bacterium]MBD5301770.1 hypothetical protein [Bacteroides sp.]
MRTESHLQSLPYIIIGLTPQGLSLLRTFSRAGATVYAFYNSYKNVGRFSKYGVKKYFETIDSLKEQIAEIIAKFHCKPICYIASGEMLALILSEFPELYAMCNVSSGPFDVIKDLAHKDRIYNYARSLGFHIPNYVTLDSYKPGSIKFPAFIKRNYEIKLFFKAEKIKDESELMEYMSRIDKNNLKDIILQEYISGDKIFYLSSQCFFVDGKLAGCLITNEKRRFKNGITSTAEELPASKLKSEIEGLCTNFFLKPAPDSSEISSSNHLPYRHYSGLADFEFIYDARNDKLWFMEINTRSSGLQSSLVAKFSNIAEVLLNPDKYIKLIPAVERVRWMNILRDIRVRLRYRNFSNLTDIFHSSFDDWDVRDPRPFFSTLLPKKKL